MIIRSIAETKKTLYKQVINTYQLSDSLITYKIKVPTEQENTFVFYTTQHLEHSKGIPECSNLTTIKISYNHSHLHHIKTSVPCHPASSALLTCVLSDKVPSVHDLFLSHSLNLVLIEILLLASGYGFPLTLLPFTIMVKSFSSMLSSHIVSLVIGVSNYFTSDLSVFYLKTYSMQPSSIAVFIARLTFTYVVGGTWRLGKTYLGIHLPGYINPRTLQRNVVRHGEVDAIKEICKQDINPQVDFNLL